MKPTNLALALLFLSTTGMSATVQISSPSSSSSAALQRKLESAGTASNIFIKKPVDDSIILVTKENLEAELIAVKSRKFRKSWFILLDESKSIDAGNLETRLHADLPASRISLVSDSKAAALKIKEIIREQNRLKAEIAGLKTVASPEDDKVLPVNDWRSNSPVAPLGSAVLTKSGLLEQTGIRAIIHTASGAMMRQGPGYEPSADSVANSLINAASLAREHGHERVALPIIAGSIFRNRMNNGQGISLETLVNLIVDALAKEAAGMKFILTVRADNPQEGVFIRKSLERLSAEDRARFEISDDVLWAIVKFEAHKATAVINSANMEVLFGGGVSGIVADAANGNIPGDKEGEEDRILSSSAPRTVQPSEAIDEEANKKILVFRTIK